ncbi:hypothetical protein PIB30_049653 [Stylosanthes scabra]|uniref:Wall-associated receptor kinase galacturonan-binding domain-containing protein n=1 Tax=Stylosanthes scabra TaxID=79078 RepID=A0ABU6SIJ6_9FABA|nr:hypothetical protein [Stylosanthes scabra]
MSRRKALLCSLIVIHLLLQTCCCASHQKDKGPLCAPSSCGEISDIKYPFRLKDDPSTYCGVYKLSCENNRTLFELFPNKSYHVEAIHYNNFTIRLVDPAFSESRDKDNCSTLPRYALFGNQFGELFGTVDQKGDFYYDDDDSPLEDERLDSTSELKNVIFLRCSNPVKDDPRYVETSPCTKQEGGDNFYAVVGNMMVSEIKDDCHVNLVAAFSRPVWDDSSNLSSYAEIQRKFSYGIDLSWMQGIVCPSICGKWTYCVLNETAPNNITCENSCFTLFTGKECGKKSNGII